MRLIASTEELKNAVAIAGNAVDRQTTLPILSHLLCRVDADADRLSLTGSNLELTVTTEIEVEIEKGKKPPESFTLPADKLRAALNSARSEQVKIAPAQERATITAGSARFALAMLAPEEFPAPPEHKRTPITIPGAMLRTMLEATLPASATKDPRYYLVGIYMESDGERLLLVGTNGHRLHVAEQPMDIEAGLSLILPKSSARILSRLLPDEEISVEYSETDLTANLGATRITTKLIDGRFPDWRRIIPTGELAKSRCNAHALRQAISACRIVTTQPINRVQLDLSPDLIQLSATNAEAEEATDQISAQNSGDDISIGFNADYLAEALDAIAGSDADITIASMDSAILRSVKPAGDIEISAVVMAMRI